MVLPATAFVSEDFNCLLLQNLWHFCIPTGVKALGFKMELQCRLFTVASECSSEQAVVTQL